MKVLSVAALLVVALAVFSAPSAVDSRPISSVLSYWPLSLIPSFQEFKAPDFCHDADCPTFTNQTKSSKYEVRNYDPGEEAGLAVKHTYACM